MPLLEFQSVGSRRCMCVYTMRRWRRGEERKEGERDGKHLFSHLFLLPTVAAGANERADGKRVVQRLVSQSSSQSFLGAVYSRKRQLSHSYDMTGAPYGTF